ncbi:glycosyltransferase family 39 protein [Hydrogenophaga sp.]|uniref:ArnT family glycosyltransferase n=1 Tax=Hydrogenophaga sp. TaxID=1904254 RepID=UPI002731AC48|nr:glycosyltransferase family 39 protein [Hydrogenophaga sp.]MDP2073791.1 glycosyltransferase family 39 protein [Hydrogenophaga sp.]
MVVVALLFLQAPHGGAFYWSDAPRHALNGVFVKDLLLDLPLDDPAGYAYRYYAQYPALTILFYPPLFYAISAPFYALLGVSHETALFVVFLHYVAYGLGCFTLARFWLSAISSLAFALLMVLLPEIAFWGRQVMLEIPAFAFLVWSAVALLQYVRGSPVGWLYLCAGLLVCALYTKISVAYVGLVYFIVLLQREGLGLVRNKHVYVVGLLSVVALVPLAVLTVKFGQANVQSVTGVADTVASRLSLEAWIWYARQIPAQVGWPLTVLAGLGFGYACALARAQSSSLEPLRFWALWFAIGYLFFSSIDLKEARHSVFLLAAVVFVAVWFLDSVLPRKWASGALCLVVASTAAATVLDRPVFYVKGYAEVVDMIAKQAPRDSVVLFSGYRDGSFIFNMRTREDRRDLSVLRADKILLSVAVRRELGVEEKNLSEAEIAQTLNDNGVHYVVMQPGFWSDLEAMRRFERVMATPQFEEVARIATPANHKAHEIELVVYRNLGKVGPKPAKLNIELKIINRQITVQ